MPKEGQNFAAINCFSEQTDWETREYIQGVLLEKLEAGKEYCVSFYASRAESSKWATSNLGAYVGQRAYDSFAYVPDFLRLKYDVSVASPNPLRSNKDWEKISGTFVAKGGERFITIGIFDTDSLLVVEKQNDYKNSSFYYIDDVSIVPVEGAGSCDEMIAEKVFDEIKPPPPPPIPTVPAVAEFDPNKVDFVVGDRLILKNVYFDLDKADLLPMSFKELDLLIKSLQNNPNMKISLEGHTDNQGSATYNRALSEKRVQSVKNYLVSKGIDTNRLTKYSYGMERPIATNSTEEGRAKNRRVEFRVTSIN